MVNLRLTATGAITKPRLRELQRAANGLGGAVKGERPVYFAEAGAMVKAKVYDRYRLSLGHRVEGPAIVEEIDSTVVIHPGYCAEVDRYGNLLIEERHG